MSVDPKKFVEENAEAIVKAACSFPFREAVDAIVNVAKIAGIKDKESLWHISRAAYDAAYKASEDMGIDKAFELAKDTSSFSTDEEYDAFADAVLEELADTKLEPYVGDEYEQFQ